jgi:hypothetical protein
VDFTFFPAGKSYFWEALDKVWGLVITGGTTPATDVQCYIILKGTAKKTLLFRPTLQLLILKYFVQGTNQKVGRLKTTIQFVTIISDKNINRVTACVKILVSLLEEP